MNKMNIKRIACIVISALALSACSGNDKYDSLIVTDGNGKRYLLKHHIGDTYLVQDSLTSVTKHEYVASANKRLLEVK